MTLLFIEGADHYDTSVEMALKWDSSVGDWDPSTAAVRSGVRGMRKSSGASPTLRRNLVATYPTLVVGFAYRRVDLANSDTVVAFHESGSEHVSVRVASSTGTLTVTRNGTVLATASGGAINPTVWSFIEFKATIHDTTGAFELRVNDSPVASGTNVDTRNGGTGVINQLAFGGQSNAGVADVDDVYLLDTSGSSNNDFLGDCKVDTIFPTGNGNSSQLTGSDADSTDNYLLIDENDMAVADYVQSTADDQTDTYAFGNLSVGSGTVFGLQIVASALKTDAGAKSLALITRSGVTDYASSDMGLSTSQAMHRHLRETDPDTAVAWTVSGVNAAEFGVKSRA